MEKKCDYCDGKAIIETKMSRKGTRVFTGYTCDKMACMRKQKNDVAIWNQGG